MVPDGLDNRVVFCLILLFIINIMPSADFDAAAAKAKALTKASNDDLLALYKYFKQVRVAVPVPALRAAATS